MPPYDPTQYEESYQGPEPVEVSSLGSAAKIGMTLIGVGLGVGTYKSLRYAERGALADVRHVIEPLSLRLGRMGHDIRQAFSSIETPRVFNAGIFRSINDQFAEFISAPSTARKDMRRTFREAVESKYTKPEGLHTGLPDEYDYLTVGEVLEEYGKKTQADAKDLGGGRRAYQIFGRLMGETELQALDIMAAQAEPIYRKTDIIGRGIFLHKKDRVVAEAMTLGSVRRALTEQLHFPLIGNPLDFIFRGQQPDMVRVSAKNMEQMGFDRRRGFAVGDTLYSVDKGGQLRKLGTGYKSYGTDTSEARAIASYTSEFAETQPIMGQIDEATGELGEGLAEKGFYDHPILQSIVDKKIGGKSVNDILENISGKRLNFSYEVTGKPPVTAKLDQWLQSHGLDVYSSRYAIEPKTIYGKIFDFLRRFGNTDPYAKNVDVIAGKWHPTKGVVRGEEQLNLFERMGHAFGRESSAYAHLTPEEAIMATDESGVLRFDRLRQIRGVASARMSRPFGSMSPNERQLARNLSQGNNPFAPVAAEHVTVKGGLLSDLRMRAMQGSQTTVRLIEAMTGMGVKPMGPTRLMGTAALTGIAAYMAWEGLHFFDYLLEKANPFGDVGIKKSMLGTYAGIKVGQQALINYSLTPLAEGADAVMPGFIDSFLGYAFRAMAGIAIGGAIGKGMVSAKAGQLGLKTPVELARAKTRASGIGAAIGALALGTSSMLQDWSDLKDEYMGNKLVEVRENRWWGLGPQDFMGGDVTRMRKHWLAQEMGDDKYDIYGGKGAYFLNVSPLSTALRTPLTSWTGLPGTDPYYVERRNYNTHPYPLTGKIFTDVPIIGPLLGETVGEMFKPTKIMHGQAIRDMIKNRGQRDELRDIANDLGYDMVQPAFTVPRKSNMLDAAGQSLDRLMDFWGMRGFIIGFAKKQITGTQDFFADGVRYQDATDLYSVSKRYYDMELGGALGSTELLRRFLPGQKRRDEINPMVETFYNDFNSSGGFKVYPGSPFMGGEGNRSQLIPGEHRNPTNPSTGWNMGLKPSLPMIPYAFSKLYYRETPLQLYKDRVTVGDNFADWTNPYESMLLPYIRKAADRDIVDATTSGAALAVLGRDPYSAMILGLMGAGAGAASSLLNDGQPHEEEARRREIEAYFDKLKFQKIERLTETAKQLGRNDVAARLDKMSARTMAGLNYGNHSDRFMEEAYLALPKADRRFLVDFAHAPKEYHDDILDEVPDYMTPMLQKIWAERQGGEAAASLAIRMSQEAISGAPAPGPGWAGWRPDVSLDDIKLASVQFDGKDIHDYGFWGADERDLARTRSFTRSLVALPDMGAMGEEMINIRKMLPVNNMQIFSRPTVGISGDNSAYLDIMYDRSANLNEYEYRYSGRF